MKGEIIKKKHKKQFESIILQLTIDDIKEARLLFHVMNRTNLLTRLKTKNTGYDFDSYNSEVAESLCYEEIRELIIDHIEDQGFKL